MKGNRRPNPGSDAAIAQDCTCPRLDNNYGAGMASGVFVMSGDCPLHGKKAEPARWRKHREQGKKEAGVNPPGQITPETVLGGELAAFTGFSAKYLLDALQQRAHELYPKAKHVAMVSFDKLGWRFVEAVRLRRKGENHAKNGR